MMKMNKNKKGQAGFVITVELLLIVTVLVIGLLTGWAKLRDQVIAELSDAGDAIGAIDNGYEIFGTNWATAADVAVTNGFGYLDAGDIAAATAVGGDGETIDYQQATVLSTVGNPAEDDHIFP